MARKKTIKLFPSSILKKVEADIEELEETDELFVTSPPETYSDMKLASSAAKSFWKTLLKYQKKKYFDRLTTNLQERLKKLDENNSVYDPEDDF